MPSLPQNFVIQSNGANRPKRNDKITMHINSHTLDDFDNHEVPEEAKKIQPST